MQTKTVQSGYSRDNRTFEVRTMTFEEVKNASGHREVGDLMWYIAILMDELFLQFGIRAYEILEANIAKLRQRYPDKFDETQALNRNMYAEREILEKK